MSGLKDLFSKPSQQTPVGGYSPVTGYDPNDIAGLLKSSGTSYKSITNAGVTAPVQTDPSFMQSMLGYTDAGGQSQSGWGGLALGAIQGIGGAYMGMKQFGLAKDTLKENKRQYDQNYQAQKTLTNSQLEDRQAARVASNAGAYASVGDYMKKNGIN